MHIIARRTLIDFYADPKYQDSEMQLKAWWHEAQHADWKTPVEIKRHYGNASILADNRVVFNICGNKYRLVVKFNYQTGTGFIRFIGTHAQYDQIDVETI